MSHFVGSHFVGSHFVNSHFPRGIGVPPEQPPPLGQLRTYRQRRRRKLDDVDLRIPEIPQEIPQEISEVAIQEDEFAMILAMIMALDSLGGFAFKEDKLELDEELLTIISIISQLE